jgi:hypothetical protein
MVRKVFALAPIHAPAALQAAAAHTAGRARDEDSLHNFQSAEEMWLRLSGMSREFLGRVAARGLNTTSCIEDVKRVLFGSKTFSTVVRQLLLWAFSRADLALHHDQWPGSGGLCSPVSPSIAWLT